MCFLTWSLGISISFWPWVTFRGIPPTRGVGTWTSVFCVGLSVIILCHAKLRAYFLSPTGNTNRKNTSWENRRSTHTPNLCFPVSVLFLHLLYVLSLLNIYLYILKYFTHPIDCLLLVRPPVVVISCLHVYRSCILYLFIFMNNYLRNNFFLWW